MTVLLWGLLKPFWPIIAGVIGVIGALFVGRMQGKAKAQKDAQWQRAVDYSKTRKVLDDESMDADPSAARDRLRARDHRKP